MLPVARPVKGRGRRTLTAAATWVALTLGGALPANAQREPRQPRPGEGIEAVDPTLYRDGGAAAAINAVLPPPPVRPVAVPCPEPAHLAPEGDLSQIAWIFVGVTTAGMLLAAWWGVTQMKRTKIYREELSRIRIHRTSSIRTGRKLGEVQMPPPGLGKRPEAAATTESPAPTPAATRIPATPQPRMVMTPAPMFAAPPSRAESAATLASVRAEADARLAMAQSQLEPLLRVARATDEWFRSREFERVLEQAGAGAQRARLDRVRRGVAASSATIHALRDARVFPTTVASIDEELARYWQQARESLDDVRRLVELATFDEAARPAGAELVRGQLERLLDAARAYAGSGPQV